ncbi:MAG TPA: PAS domain S-box protein [Arsenicitalea sp.]|nr:PAS domain S-box protein [Arsenicitalea sp.]
MPQLRSVGATIVPIAAGLLALAIFTFDIIAPLGIGVAVLYVVVVLLLANTLPRRGVLLVSVGCVVVSLLGYVVQHGLATSGPPFLRLLIDLVAIALAAVLATRNQSFAGSLDEKARLLDLAHDTVFARDARDIITYWNHGAEQLYGWSSAEAIGKVCHELTRTVFPAPLETINAELLRTGRWEGELVHSTRDGTQVTVASRWSLQRDRHGNPVATLETNNDITEQKRAESALRDSEERWRAVFEHNPTMYFMVDQAGTVVSVNPFGAEKLGYSVDELVGRSVLDIFVADDREAARRNVATCLEQFGTTLSWELRKLRKDGTVLWVAETARAIVLKGGPVVLIVCEDITARKQTEQDLKETELRLSTIIGNAPMVLFTLDRAGIFTLSEGKGLEILGLMAGQVVGQSVFDVYRDEPSILANVRLALSGASFTGNSEQNQRNLESHYIPFFDESGQVAGVNGVAFDVTERVQAERELSRSQAYLAEAQRLSQTGSFGWRVADQKILWSEESYRIFGYDPAPSVRLEMIFDRTHPQDLAWVQGTVEQAARDEADFDIEHRLLMPDGSVKFIRVVAHAEHDEAGQLEYVGAMMDITSAKETERRIQQIIDTVPAFIWTSRADGTINFLNKRCLDYDGLTLEQALATGWGGQLHPDDYANSRSRWLAALAEKRPYEAEARTRRFDGQYRWFLSRAFPLLDQSGQILGWYGSETDIHDRRLAEEKLQHSEANLLEAQRLSHSGSFVRNVATGELLWSDEMFRIFGYDPAVTTPTVELLLDRVHPEEREVVRERIERAQDRTDPSFDEEYRLQMPDGTIKYIRNLRGTSESATGALTVVGTVMDVTQQRLAEQALHKAQTELAHVSRVTTFGEFAASIAHEVNQPLAAIVTNGEVCLRLLEQDSPDLPEVREAVGDVIRDGRRASEIIRRLRSLTTKSEPEKLVLDLNAIIREVIPLVRQEVLSHQVLLRLELDPTLPPVLGDGVQLQQVIVNLVANAVESMASVTNRPRNLTIRSRTDDLGQVVIEVKDSGVGIDPQNIGRLFNAFFTTKSDGMGMGLSICRSIIESHGGSMMATPNAGPGATVWFALPSTEETLP